MCNVNKELDLNGNKKDARKIVQKTKINTTTNTKVGSITYHIHTRVIDSMLF